LNGKRRFNNQATKEQSREGVFLVALFLCCSIHGCLAPFAAKYFFRGFNPCPSVVENFVVAATRRNPAFVALLLKVG
jgi:hypothetical protein